MASRAVAAGGEVAQRGHDRGPVAHPNVRMVLGEGHVWDPVQFVLDRLVLADDFDQMVGADVAEAQVGDRVDGLGVPDALVVLVLVRRRRTI